MSRSSPVDPRCSFHCSPRRPVQWLTEDPSTIQAVDCFVAKLVKRASRWLAIQAQHSLERPLLSTCTMRLQRKSQNHVLKFQFLAWNVSFFDQLRVRIMNGDSTLTEHRQFRHKVTPVSAGYLFGRATKSFSLGLWSWKLVRSLERAHSFSGAAATQRLLLSILAGSTGWNFHEIDSYYGLCSLVIARGIILSGRQAPDNDRKSLWQHIIAKPS